MFPMDEFPAPFDKERRGIPKVLQAQWKSAHQQADNIDLFHEAEMEGGSPFSPGGASADSLEFVSSPHSQDDDLILQQKKPSPDSADEWNGGFAKRGWSRSLNGFSKSMLAKTYLDQCLTPFQRTQLCECYLQRYRSDFF
jgi:hypothetical protein